MWRPLQQRKHSGCEKNLSVWLVTISYVTFLEGDSFQTNFWIFNSNFLIFHYSVPLFFHVFATQFPFFKSPHTPQTFLHFFRPILLGLYTMQRHVLLKGSFWWCHVVNLMILWIWRSLGEISYSLLIRHDFTGCVLIIHQLPPVFWRILVPNFLTRFP